MNILLVFIIILFITIVGYTIIKGFQLTPNYTFLETLGFSYGLGVGLIALQFFGYARLGLPWTKPIIFTPWTVLIGFYILKYRKHIRIPKIQLPKLNKLQGFFLIIILLASLYTFFEVILRPVSVKNPQTTDTNRPARTGL